MLLQFLQDWLQSLLVFKTFAQVVLFLHDTKCWRKYLTTVHRWLTESLQQIFVAISYTALFLQTKLLHAKQLHSSLEDTKNPLKVICNGFSKNWWKVVSSCLLQYKSVYVINFDKLRCKMLKSKCLVVFWYSYSSAHRHAWRHIRMCLLQTR